jgi:hypothetical protein
MPRERAYFTPSRFGERQVPQAPGRIDFPGGRDRDGNLAQLGDHSFEGGEYGLTVTYTSTVR